MLRFGHVFRIQRSDVNSSTPSVPINTANTASRMRPAFFVFFCFLCFIFLPPKSITAYKILTFLYNRLTYYSKDRFKKIENFYKTFHRQQNLIERNVAFYGSYFQEDDAAEIQQNIKNVFEVDKIEQFLSEKKKLEILSYMKAMLHERIYDKTLRKKEIQISGLFVDDNLNQLGQKASQSVLDMIRWTNYLIDCTFQYEESVQKNYSLNEKVDQYIREHYRENIGRTEIAEQFYLAPEYLSKTYKKLTGRTIKDTITEYRIDEAKRMLERGERVSDVAETVGFDNFTYFSTIFKKYTGVSPNQYCKK